MATYSKSSPYSTTKENNLYLELLNIRPVPAEDDDYLYTIESQYTNRPDLLAFDLYNDVNLWWVFVVRNPNTLRNPIFDFTTGTVIYIPTKETVNSALGL